MKEDKIEDKLEMYFELFLGVISETNSIDIPSMTVFFDSSYNTYSIFPYEGETRNEFTERVNGLEKDIHPIVILGCDPIKDKLYNGILMILHTESNIERCFYHKKNYKIDEGWVENFD